MAHVDSTLPLPNIHFTGSLRGSFPGYHTASSFRNALCVWVDRLESRAAEIRDYLDEQLSQMDWVDGCHNCPYLEGDAVLLRQPECRWKRQAPYEAGWVVSHVVAPLTVKIVNGGRSKLVNIELIKMDPSPTKIVFMKMWMIIFRCWSQLWSAMAWKPKLQLKTIMMQSLSTE